MNEEARYKGISGPYSSVPNSETANGHRYTVGVRDVDGESCFVLTQEVNQLAVDMAESDHHRLKTPEAQKRWDEALANAKTERFTIPVNFEGVVLEVE